MPPLEGYLVGLAFGIFFIIWSMSVQVYILRRDARWRQEDIARADFAGVQQVHAVHPVQRNLYRIIGDNDPNRWHGHRTQTRPLRGHQILPKRNFLKKLCVILFFLLINKRTSQKCVTHKYFDVQVDASVKKMGATSKHSRKNDVQNMQIRLEIMTSKLCKWGYISRKCGKYTDLFSRWGSFSTNHRHGFNPTNFKRFINLLW